MASRPLHPVPARRPPRHPLPSTRPQAVSPPQPGIRELEDQLATLRLEFAEMHRQLFEAAQMQRKLSGPRWLRRGDFEATAEIFPVLHLSGDFFNVSDLGRTMLLAIGDIAGKGLMAGMWFTYLLGLTRTFGIALKDPATALTSINREVNLSLTPPVTSLFLARLDLKSGELAYCNAGHPPPIRLEASGSHQFLDTGGPLLGAVPDFKYSTGRVTLRPGDTLVGYSDGLLECRNQHDEEFGVERVLHEARSSAMAPPSVTLFSIIGAAQDFAGSQAREDDCTLLVVRRKA